MKTLLKLEELAEFLFGIFFFSLLNYAWWWFPVLLFMPDISMVGYFVNLKAGAWLYNLVHHKGIAILCILCGYVLAINELSLAGSILLSHTAMDRFLGYGLKHETGFKNTHLGKI
jgi:Domain of unknown function (DUF4260)